MKILPLGIIFIICFLFNVSYGARINNSFQINDLNVSVKCIANICTTCIGNSCVSQDGRQNEKKCLKGVCTECYKMICTTRSEDKNGTTCVINLKTGSSEISPGSVSPINTPQSSRNRNRFNNVSENTVIDENTAPASRAINNFDGSRQYGRMGRSSKINNSENNTLKASSNTSYKINGRSYTIECGTNNQCVTCVFDYTNKPFCKTQDPFSRSRVCTYGVCTTCNRGICVIHSINNKCDPIGGDFVKQNPNRIVMTRIDLNNGEIQQCNEQGAYFYTSSRAISIVGGIGNDSNSEMKIVNSDGDFGIIDADGSKKITKANGDIESIGADGSRMITKANGDSEIIGVDGSKRITKANGDSEIIGADGSKRITKANGDSEIIGADGSKRILKANGDSEIIGADGSRTTTKATGDTESIGADGSKRITKANGDFMFIGADGSQNIRKTNGDSMIIGADGSKRIEKSNGDSMVIGADGSKTISKANGATAITRADGTTIKKMANGSIASVGPFKNRLYDKESDSLDFTDISDVTWDK